MVYLRESTATAVLVGPFLDQTDGYTTEESLTVASIDVRLYKFTNTHPISDVTITPAASGSSHDMEHVAKGYYSLELTTTDTNTQGRMVLSANISGALPVWQEFMVVRSNVYDSFYLEAGTDLLQVDLRQVNNSTTPAGNLEDDYNGTGYSKSNSTIGTATSVTNQVTADVQQWDGTNVSLTGTLPAVDTTAISGSTTAANNLEEVFDGDGTGGPMRVSTLNVEQIIASTSAGSAVSITSSHATAPAVNITGHIGIHSTGNGAEGILVDGNTNGATICGYSGNGISALSQLSGDGIYAEGASATGGNSHHGIQAVGGSSTTSGDGGHGFFADGGAAAGTDTGGHGILAEGGSGGTSDHGNAIRAISNSTAIYAASNSSGHGIYAAGGATTGHGIYALGTSNTVAAHGIRAVGANDGHGVSAEGEGIGDGINSQGGATGDGIFAQGGATSGNGLTLVAQDSTNGDGIAATGDGTGAGISAIGESGGNGIYTIGGIGIKIVGQDSDGIESTGASSGHGFQAVGGDSGSGIVATAGNTASGAGFLATGSTNGGAGIEAEGDGGNAGIYAHVNGGGGAGFRAAGGANGIEAQAASNGHGFHSVGDGSGHGIFASADQSSGTGSGFYALGGDSSGYGIYAQATDAVRFAGTATGLIVVGGSGEAAFFDGATHGIYTEGNSGDGIRSVSIAGNGNGIYALAQGSGHGIFASADQSTGTGHGLYALGGDSSGSGIQATSGTGSPGIVGTSSTGVGIRGNGGTDSHGIGGFGNGNGSGIYGVGGDGTGDGILGQADADGSGAGIHAAGSDTGGHAFSATSGSSGGDAIYANANSGGYGMRIISSNTSAAFFDGGTYGIDIEGNNGDGVRFRSLSGNGSGIALIGNGSGHGIYSVSGDGSGHGIFALGGDETGTGDGIRAQGGPDGGAGIHARADGGDDNGMTLTKDGSGKDIDADEIDNIPTLSTTVDGTTLETIYEYTMAMANGKYDLDTPSVGNIRFYERDNATPLFDVDVTKTGRTRL